MNNNGDAAEQIVRLSMEGMEIVARLSGSAAKNIAILLAAALKNEMQQTHKTRGKMRLTNMIKSGKELKVFALPQKDLKTFVRQAKKYGVLYCVLKDSHNKNPEAMVDVIARAEDASKIQRIFDRFELGNVDKDAIIKGAEQEKADRETTTDTAGEVRTDGATIVEQALGVDNEESKREVQESKENPPTARTEEKSQSGQESKTEETKEASEVKSSDKKESVREKIERKRQERAKDKADTALSKEEADKKPKAPGETKHKQPRRRKKQKERT